MTEFFCKDCDSFMIHGECIIKETLRDRHGNICSSFVTKDGKRPRFCRLASSVDEMVKEITDTALAYVEVSRNSCGKPVTFSDEEKRRISAEIKAWLLGVEE